MAPKQQALRNLLAVELPLERVGPHLRQAARRALRADEPERLLLVARAVVGELQRRGDLLRVAVEESTPGEASPESLCLLKGTNRVVDIGVLGGESIAIRLPAELRPLGRTITNPQPDVAIPPGLKGFAGMLGAMEDAQDLEIGDPQSGEKAVVLSGILRLLGKFTPQFRLFVLLDEEGDLPESSAGIFAAEPADAAAHWLSLRGEGQSVWIPAPAELPRPIVAAMRAESGDPFAATSAVAVPLCEPDLTLGRDHKAREVGLLFVVARDEWGREALLRLADRLTRFVTRRWQHQWEVNQRIHTDSLTGAFNRAYFDKQFTMELERARRSDGPLTLIMADLDNFKQVNDNFGHQVGDRILQMVARRVQEELRRIDHICRIGGEEFAFILPDTDQEAGQEVAARLLDAAYTEEVVHDNQVIELRVTFSYGAVTFPDAGADAFELYRKADAMLYLSKDLGRNQCHFWNSRGDHRQLQPSAAHT